MTATAGKTYYRPGLVFKAAEKAQGHQECCYPGAPEIRNHDGTLQREDIRPLFAEFGVYGSEFSYEDPLTGTTEIGSEFRGGYFNLDQQADEKGWDDRERELVARHMIRLADTSRAQFSLYSAPKAAAPWPTYDATHHNQIATLAQTLGLVGESLAYEEQNKARPGVIEKLREAAKAPAEEVEELVAE